MNEENIQCLTCENDWIKKYASKHARWVTTAVCSIDGATYDVDYDYLKECSKYIKKKEVNKDSLETK